MESKICKICQKDQPLINYYIRKTNKDGLYGKCKSCCMEAQIKYRRFGNGKNVLNKYNKSKKGKKSRAKFIKTEKYKISQLKWQKSEKGRECSRKASAKWIKNPKNKKKAIKNSTLYKKKRYETDELYKAEIIARRAINRIIKAKKINKNNKSIDYLGCSFREFKLYIESKFQPGMTWENHGKWHIDHIIPLKIANDEQDLFKLNHYTNLQPLWAKDNLKKAAKILNEKEK